MMAPRFCQCSYSHKMLSQSLRSLSHRSSPAVLLQRLPVLRNSCAIHTLPVQTSPSPASSSRHGRIRGRLHQQPHLNLHSLRYRTMSTPPPQVNESHLTMEEYHNIADRTMEHILETMEDMVEKRGNDEHEVDYHSGVLTLHVGDHGTYVINKQPPNKQIWLSSPKSGPKRYDYQESTRTWVYSRDNKTLDELLSEELGAVYGVPISFVLDD